MADPPAVTAEPGATRSRRRWRRRDDGTPLRTRLRREGGARDAEPRREEDAPGAERRREEAAPAAEPRRATTAPPGELSGLRLLLDQLDELLRDPTLTRALRRFAARIAHGVRQLGTAIRLPRLRLPRVRLPRLRLPHISRWLLLLPLLLLLAVGLPALLSPGDDKRAAPAPSSAGLSLPGVGMPDLRTAPDDPPPARVALVVDDTYSPAALQRELRSLGAWLRANHAPDTRVSVIDAATGRASAPLSAAALARGDLGRGALARGAPTRSRTATRAAIRAAFNGRGRRLLVNVGSPAPASSASTLTVVARRGAGAPASVPLRRGRRSRVAIDSRRPDALAASVARALIAISGQSERR
ncbi:MAG: hypothetical protein QOJ46_2432 [bacterium]